MKKNTIICVYILCITTLYTPLHTITVIDGTKQQAPLPKLPPPVKDIIQSTAHQTGETRPPLYINVNYLPNENNFVIGDSAIKLFFMRAYGLVKETVQSAATQCGEFAHAQELTIRKTLATAVNYVQQHKIQTALATVFLTYIAIQARILYLTRLLREQQSCWSLWHYETPLEEFFTLPPHQFCSDLLAEIQRRYATPNTAYDFVASLTQFITDADQEVAWLKEYKTLSEFLVRCKIRDLSLINQEIAAECADRIQRLAYIKGTFLGWITEYRLGMRPAHAGGLPF